ncbi:MAG: hypothetical protein JO284_04515 [Planctomycetaceae bacterium]|nr:hypothetical protein [Planctomycetaceae bacterium]MBV8611017.1 hypothetical protein [Singulisphaera sp.]MBV8230308.1 hypothetical protein [Planctomycetaceae bacterium]MBV8268208.1 hypothetical protein [Planctomycetaceae bacterium]MBV8317040.1 hypothetical protein [Planctomycetaceae bacterium]
MLFDHLPDPRAFDDVGADPQNFHARPLFERVIEVPATIKPLYIGALRRAKVRGRQALGTLGAEAVVPPLPVIMDFKKASSRDRGRAILW